MCWRQSRKQIKKKLPMGAGEVVWWMCLPGKDEGLSLDPQRPHTRHGDMCLSLWHRESGSREDHRASWPASLTVMTRSSFCGKSCLKMENMEKLRTVSYTNLWPTYSYTHIHTHTHVCILIHIHTCKDSQSLKHSHTHSYSHMHMH